MSPILFVDLDDTLFHSSRKNAAAPRDPVAFDRAGGPQSFMTPKQRALYEWLARDAEVVATTGRSTGAYRRVDLRLGGFAICSHGGVILQPDGRPEPRWRERMAAGAAAHRDALLSLLGTARSLAAKSGIDARTRTIAEGELDLYLSIKHCAADVTELARLAAVLVGHLPSGWRLHLNANNLAALPPYLGKAPAVSWFLQEIAPRDVFSVGFGDSLSDVPFMALTDYALTPSGSQLFSSLLAGTS
jgi:hypothetical protein